MFYCWRFSKLTCLGVNNLGKCRVAASVSGCVDYATGISVDWDLDRVSEKRGP